MDATPSAQGSAFRCTIAATADAATQLQQQFTAWLDTACRPSAQRRDDVVLAVGEATNNAVEHAYACTRTGQVEVNAAMRPTGELTVTISDRGVRRRDPSTAPYRGCGLSLIGDLSDSSNITTNPNGTTIALYWRRIGPGARQ